MSNIHYASSYKNKIINLLLKNDNFIKLINPVESEHPELDIIDVLLGGKWIIHGEEVIEQGHVFDYDFVGDTTTEEKTFVFVETDIPSISKNTFTSFTFYICVFSEKGLVRISDATSPTVKEVKEMGCYVGRRANRVDTLCEIIDKTLNGNVKISGIGTIRPTERNHCTIYKPNNNYYGKCLRYTVTNLNEIEDDCFDK